MKHNRFEPVQKIAFLMCFIVSFSWSGLLGAVDAAQDSSVRFAIIGDYGFEGPNEESVATLVKGWKPQFIITTGDNNYEEGAASTIDRNIGQYFHSFIKNYKGSFGSGSPDMNRFFPSLGNHDWRTPGAVPYLDYFTLPGNKRYYDFTWGPIHFFAIDSDPHEPSGTGSSSVQASWLKAGLAAAPEPWKVVYFHHPAYSSGHHGSNLIMQWPFKEWGASIVISGHDHDYERIKQNGLTYIVNGLGGKSLYPIENPISGSQVRYSSDFGAQLVEATSTQITFKFYTRAHKLIDTYKMEGSNRP